MDKHALLVKGEGEKFKELLGKMDKHYQIETAVHYESFLRNSEDDCRKRQLVRNYISKTSLGLHARVEMQIYRMMGETSMYFTHEQVLDLETLKQFAAVLEFWAFLALQGDPILPLLEHKDIQRCMLPMVQLLRSFELFWMCKRIWGSRTGRRSI